MTIALIEDDEAVRDSLSLLLKVRGLDTRAFDSAEAFFAVGDDYRPACIVSDVRLPAMSGLDLQRKLRERGCTVPVIFITGHGDIPMAVAAIRDGAFDFIEKPYDAEQLIANIKRALAASQKVRSREDQKAELLARMAELSPRQREVMHLVAKGFSNKQVAKRLQISPRTVENYRAWVMERLGAMNVADLVRKVLVVEASPGD